PQISTLFPYTTLFRSWFDHFESLKLSPGSTLKLMKFIGEHSTPGKPSLPETLRCPRCATALRLAHDLQGNMPFTYWRCATDDGRSEEHTSELQSRFDL